MWLKFRSASNIAGPRGFLPQVVRDSNCVHNTCPVSSSNVDDFIFSQLITRVFCKANECFFADSVTRVLDPYVFCASRIRILSYLSGSGSGSFYINKQKIKINNEFFRFVTSQWRVISEDWCWCIYRSKKIVEKNSLFLTSVVDRDPVGRYGIKLIALLDPDPK